MGSSMSEGNFQIPNILMNRRSNLEYISGLTPFLIYSLEGGPDFHSKGMIHTQLRHFGKPLEVVVVIF